MRMNKGRVALLIEKENFGKVKIKTPDGVMELQIDTGFERAHHQTQYSKVVAVSDDETEIKVGMMVFHNHNVYSDSRQMLDTDVFWTPREFIFGTEQKMFGDYVMVERVYEEKDIVLGCILSYTIKTVLTPSKSKCKVLTGKYMGKTMYCTDLMFYEIVGYDKKICIAKEKQLVCDENLTLTKDKVMVVAEKDVFAVKKDSGIIVKTNWRNPTCKYGTVIKADDSFYLDKRIAYLRFYQITIGDVSYHVINTNDIECILNETINELIPLE